MTFIWEESARARLRAIGREIAIRVLRAMTEIVSSSRSGRMKLNYDCPGRSDIYR